jgi:rod shape-determining protein MreC
MMAATRNRPLYILVLVLALLVLGLALDRLGYMSTVRTLFQIAFAPVETQITSVAQLFAYQIEIAANIQELQSRSAELEALANTLMVENVRLKDLERENQVLRQLLNYTRNNPQFTYETSGVIGDSIGRAPGNLVYYIYLDVGTRAGVAEHMPVITDRGLVGRVVRVGPNVAQILLLIDPSSSVNAVIQNSRVTGIVKGNLDGSLMMEQIPPGEVVEPGDIVLTSGLGGNFPDKLVIGQIVQVSERDQDMFQTARIRPTVDFGKLQTMLVLTSFEPIDFESELESEE